MHASLRVLLKEVIDYAGLFPPAGLALGPAIANYLAYRAQPDAWMLSRFICPAARLTELGERLAAMDPRPRTVPVSAVARGGASRDELLRGLRQDLADIVAFQERAGALGRVECFELRLCPATDGDYRRLVGELDAAFTGAAIADGARVFFELPLAPSWRDDLAAFTDGLQALRVARAAATPRPRLAPPGVKLRCGGLTADAFPSAEQVAGVILACQMAQTPLKFTAGLHHPLRHIDAGLQTPVHGFINVFMAGVLAYALHLEAADLQAVVEEQDARQFHFLDEGASWNDAFATASEIAVARRDCVISFGSCSFDEPREDLRRLRWM
jgi:hypothetical protein